MERKALHAHPWIIPVLAALSLTAACTGATGATEAPTAPGSSTHVALSQDGLGQSDIDQDSSPDAYDDTVIRDLYFTFDDAGWESSLQRLGEDEYVFADLEVEGVTYEDVGLRIKGNSSARGSGRKVPLNLTMDATVPGQELLGYDTLNLNSGFMNPTLAREILTLDTLRDYQPMPGAAYARVHANGTYFGVYTLVEQIEGTFLDQWYETNDGVLFKGDAPGTQAGGPSGFRSNLSWQGESLADYQSSYELKTEEAGDAGYEKLRELTRVLDAPVAEGGVSDADFPEAIEAVLDVDSALWYIAGINLFTNYDSYYSGHNYFLYWAEEDERFHILSWDVNESFGVFQGAGIRSDDSNAVAQTDPFLMASGQDASSRPLISRLLSVPSYRADYLAHYRTLLATAFAPDALEEKVSAYQDLVRESVLTDPNYIYDTALFEQNVWEDVRAGGQGRGGRAVPGLLKVVNARYTWLSAQADLRAPDNALEQHSLAPKQPTVEQDVTVALQFSGSDQPSGVDLVYRVEGSMPEAVPMRENGGTWEGTIPAQGNGDDVTYYARLAFDDGRTAFYPAVNQTQPWAYQVSGVALPAAPTGDLVINELVADNEAGMADEAGEFEDWIELYNRGAEPLSLEGYFLSDAEDDPWAFALPAVTLGPGEYYLVWADNDPDQGEHHADFRLSKDGESVHLSTRDATVDSVTFEALPTDAAFMRSPDGADEWVVCGNATPREPNTCTSSPAPTAEATPTSASTAVPTTVPPSTPTAAATSVSPLAMIFLPMTVR